MKLVVYSNVVGQPIVGQVLEHNVTHTKVKYSKSGVEREENLLNDDIISMIPDVVDPSVHTIMVKKITGIRGVFDVEDQDELTSSPDGNRVYFTTDDGRKLEISKGFYELLTDNEWNVKSGAIYQMMMGGGTF